MTTPPKRFMAELQQAARRVVPGVVAAAETAPALAPATAPSAVTVDNREVLRAIAGLEAKIDRVLTHEQTDIAQIQLEIADISGRIKATKVEIAALRHPLAGEDKFQLASEELGAVVKATEVATNSIMSCAEEIEDIIREVRAQMPDGYQSSRLGDVQETILRIYEACNFQDLTGPAPVDPDHAAHSENISQSDIDALFG